MQPAEGRSVEEDLRGTAQEVIRIGDCIAPGNMMAATSRGYTAGLDL